MMTIPFWLNYPFDMYAYSLGLYCSEYSTVSSLEGFHCRSDPTIL